VTGERIPILDSAAELTPEWLTAALAGSGTIERDRVVAVEMSDIGTGQMCDCTRVVVRYDRPARGPASLVAKLPAADETSRTTALAMRSYEKEVRFYQELAPVLPVRTPQVFHADIEVETGRFVLLLEDLAPAQAGDQIAGCSPEAAETALRELVQLHAPRWDDPALATTDWLHGDKSLGQQFLLAMLPGLWAGFCQRYEAQLNEAILEAGAGLFTHLEGYLLGDSGPSTVVHGDYRLDNLLFVQAGGRGAAGTAPGGPGAAGTAPGGPGAGGPEAGGTAPGDTAPGRSAAAGSRVVVLDWQTVTDGPALSDVAYFIGAGLHPEARRAAEDGLVRRYHAGLTAAGVAGYGWEQCWHDYRRGTWSGLVMAVAASMLVARTDRGDQMFLTMADRHARHALDLDAMGVIS
jgi:hypothetical protein